MKFKDNSSKEGLLFLAVAVVGVIVIAVGVYVFMPGSKENRSGVTAQSLKEKPFELSPDAGEVSHDLYDGKVIISGTYEEKLQADLPIQDRVLCFYPDEKSSEKIPRPDGDARTAWFCFENQNEAKIMLGVKDESAPKTACRISGSARISIRSYSLLVAESDGNDRAILESVISSTAPQFESC